VAFSGVLAALLLASTPAAAALTLAEAERIVRGGIAKAEQDEEFARAGVAGLTA